MFTSRKCLHAMRWVCVCVWVLEIGGVLIVLTIHVFSHRHSNRLHTHALSLTWLGIWVDSVLKRDSSPWEERTSACHDCLSLRSLSTATLAWELAGEGAHPPVRQGVVYVIKFLSTFNSSQLTVSLFSETIASGPYWNFAIIVGGVPVSMVTTSWARWFELRCWNETDAQPMRMVLWEQHVELSHLYLHGGPLSVPFHHIFSRKKWSDTFTIGRLLYTHWDVLQDLHVCMCACVCVCTNATTHSLISN